MIWIMYICSALLGSCLWHMGYGLSEWQFWAVLILYIAPNALWLYKDHNRSKEDK